MTGGLVVGNRGCPGGETSGQIAVPRRTGKKSPVDCGSGNRTPRRQEARP
jgi:hypothetical protein